MHQAWQGGSLSQRSSAHRRAGGGTSERNYNVRAGRPTTAADPAA